MATPVLKHSFLFSHSPPPEKLRRKDQEVSRALEEKHRLIADILSMEAGDFDHIAEVASARLAGEVSGSDGERTAKAEEARRDAIADRDAREVLLAALAQGEKRYPATSVAIFSSSITD